MRKIVSGIVLALVAMTTVTASQQSASADIEYPDHPTVTLSDLHGCPNGVVTERYSVKNTTAKPVNLTVKITVRGWRHIVSVTSNTVHLDPGESITGQAGYRYTEKYTPNRRIITRFDSNPNRASHYHEAWLNNC